METFLRDVVRRVLAREAPQPQWIPRRLLTVVTADVDATAGVGADRVASEVTTHA
ncbi:hypothetical protein ACFCX0_47435 [Streptomyces sp. NPDC056352]|uniref:hypothetical protein n=1 Tax=Streptomyces sp. NPDC056352 TaxID=3345791 RepID=UPI0035E07812